MTLDDLFYRKDEAEITHRIHIKKPETITSIKYLEWYSGNATRAIAEAEELMQGENDTESFFISLSMDRARELIEGEISLSNHQHGNIKST